MESDTLTASSGAPGVSPEKLAESYRYCAFVARTQARNFYYSFVTLPPDRKAAMCAIYAFMRYSDDVSDDEAAGISGSGRMAAWKRALERAFEGEYGDSAILPAFHDTVLRYGIPIGYFHELIAGTEGDLTRTRYETFDELYGYCYQVASVVGFTCISVWGYEPANGDALRLAEACGLAFQLTNILRDVKEDAGRDRIYLPQEDLRRFGVDDAMMLRGQMTEPMRNLLRFEAGRARGYYDQAALLPPLISPSARPTLQIMLRIYGGILDAIERSGYDVFSHRARVSSPRKLAIVADAWLGARLGRFARS